MYFVGHDYVSTWFIQLFSYPEFLFVEIKCNAAITFDHFKLFLPSIPLADTHL